MGPRCLPVEFLPPQPSQGEDGYAVLHRAAREGHASVVRLLLAHPLIDLNIRCTAVSLSWTRHSTTLRVAWLLAPQWRETPLLRSAFGRSAEVVGILLADPRVDVSAVNADDWTLMQCAHQGGDPGVIAILEGDPRISDADKAAALKEAGDRDSKCTQS